MTAIPHHRVPVDLSASQEPVYLGLDVGRAAALALSIFGTLLATTSGTAIVRTIAPVVIWSLFLGLAFADVSGYPAWQVALWGASWLWRRVKVRRHQAGRREDPTRLFRA